MYAWSRWHSKSDLALCKSAVVPLFKHLFPSNSVVSLYLRMVTSKDDVLHALYGLRGLMFRLLQVRSRP